MALQRYIVLSCLFFGLAGILLGKPPKLTADEVLERHLESIGSDADRARWSSSRLEGLTRLELLIGGSGVLEGSGSFTSSDIRSSTRIDFGRSNYSGERFLYDGSDVAIAYIEPGNRSPLGQFLFTYTGLLKEGLFGGTLSTAWPLLNLLERKSELKYKGTEKIDNVETHELEYRVGSGGRDVQIRLFFDSESFHHVMTEYKVTMTAALGATPELSAQQKPTRLRAVERFGDFESFDGITVPTSWGIEYSSEGTQRGILWKWKTVFRTVEINPTVENETFELP